MCYLTAMRNTLALLVFILMFAHSAQAQDLSDIWCDRLNDESAYEDNNLKNYRTFLHGKDGWIFRSHTGFKDDFSVKEKTKAALKELQQAFKSQGTDLVILYPPPRSIVHNAFVREATQKALGFDAARAEKAMQNYVLFIQELQEDGLHIVGLTDIDPEQQIYFKRDHHWTPQGARLMAQAAADDIKTLPVYNDLRKTEYETIEGEAEEYTGAFKKTFAKLCNNQMPSETRIRYQTQTVKTETSQDALFGDVKAPEVVLVGTSNSAASSNVANFEGFLKDALSADVENRAVTGAGIDTSMLEYLNSERAQTDPAKILVWEVPGYYSFDHMHSKVFEKAIPLLTKSEASAH